MDKSNFKRAYIKYWDGLNSSVSSNLEKSTEFTYSENARSTLIGSIEKREGSLDMDYASEGVKLNATNNYLLSYFKPENSVISLYRISEKDSVGLADFYSFNETTNYWTKISNTLGANNIDISNGYHTDFSTTIAEGCLFVTNLNDYPRYINENGSVYEYHLDNPANPTVDNLGNLVNCPKASKIKYYKNRLYVADYLYNGVRYKNKVLRSSPPLGIIALVNNDVDHVFIPGTNVNGIEVEVTDIKYFSSIQGADLYDIYRGETKVGVMQIESINEDSVSVNITTEPGQTSILAADEIWLKNTFGDNKYFRWPTKTDSTGIFDAKQYDSFSITTNDNSEIKLFETVGNVLMIASNNNISTWNDSVVTSYDLGVGCVSRNGYVKSYGTLFFMHYTGIWSTSGDAPKLISGKVEKYINGASKSGIESCAAGKKGKSVLFHIGNSTLYNPDGSFDKTISDVIIEYNITQDSWYVHSGIKADQFETFVSSLNTDRLLFLNSDTGKPVTEFLTGSTDNGKEIPFRVDTTTIQLGNNFENICYPVEVIVETERGSQIKCFASIDDNIFYEIDGKIVKGVSILTIKPAGNDKTILARGRNIKLSFRDNSKQLCRISQMAVNYIPYVPTEVEDNKEEN